jgi:hypothetical protein
MTTIATVMTMATSTMTTATITAEVAVAATIQKEHIFSYVKTLLKNLNTNILVYPI